jgi:hypothetical protein
MYPVTCPRVPRLARARFDSAAAAGRPEGNTIPVITAAKMKMPTTTVKAVTFLRDVDPDASGRMSVTFRCATYQ